MYFTKLEQLPATSDLYFIHYHENAFDGKYKSTNDLKSALMELRLAYSKYPESRARIEEMAKVVKVGLTKYDKTFTDEVAKALL